jgi:hypothetical protein
MSSLHNNTVQESADKKPAYIFKVPHKKNFTVIDNQILYNKNLSAKATCYLCILLSFPDHWKINLKHLASLKKDGIKAVKSAINELKDNGYVFYYQSKTENGQFLESIYIVSETPKTKEEIEEFKKSLPRAYFGIAAKGLTQKDRLVNTNSSNTHSNKEQKKEGDEPPPLPLNLEKLINRKKEVKTSEEEHLKLAEKLGAEVRDACYKILSDWKEDTPKCKWKKSDYRSILRWVVNAHKEQKQRASSLTESTLKHIAPEIAGSLVDTTKIEEAHKEYTAWRNASNDSYRMNLGALILDGDRMYDYNAPKFRYKITKEKYLDLLENKYKIPGGIKTKIKSILGL